MLHRVELSPCSLTLIRWIMTSKFKRANAGRHLITKIAKDVIVVNIRKKMRWNVAEEEDEVAAD